MIRIDFFLNTSLQLGNQTVAPTLPGFQVIKRCVKYLFSHPHKRIMYPSNYYDGSNVTRLTWSESQIKDYTSKNYLKYHQDADHNRVIQIRRSVSGIIHTLLGVAVFWKVQIHPYAASDSTDGEMR